MISRAWLRACVLGTLSGLACTATNDPGSTPWLKPGADIKSVSAPPLVAAGDRPPPDAKVVPGLMGCLPGGEKRARVSQGPIGTFDACRGSLEMRVGSLVIDTASNGIGPLAAIGAPDEEIRAADDCGMACTMPDEQLVALLDTEGRFDPGGKVAAIFRGHKQLRFAAVQVDSTDVNGKNIKKTVWQPEPYVYEDLIAAKIKDGVWTVLETDFASADAWALIARDGSYSLYLRRTPTASTWRIKEHNDALAAFDKRRATGVAPAMFGRGNTLEFVRDANGALLEVRDNRFLDRVLAVRIVRDPVTNRVLRIESDVDLDLPPLPPDAAEPARGDTITLTVTEEPRPHLTQVKLRGPGRAYTLHWNEDDQVDYADDPTGQRVVYRYDAQRRLVSIGDQPPDGAANEGSTAMFSYYRGPGDGRCPLDGGPGDDSNLGDPMDGWTPTSPGEAALPPCAVVTTDALGTRWVTKFNRLRTDLGDPPATQLYTRRTWKEPGKIINESVNTRNASGMLVATLSPLTGSQTSWGERYGDGSPRGRWSVERHDSSSTAGLEKSVEGVAYVARRFDDDNLLVEEISNGGRVTNTFQKEGATDAWKATLAFLAQTPAVVTEYTADATDTGNGPPKVVPHVTKYRPRLATSNDPDGAAFVVETEVEATRDVTTTVLDQRLRVVAVRTSGAAPGAWVTYRYDRLGRPLEVKDSATDSKKTFDYGTEGQLVTDATVCGALRAHQVVTEDPYGGPGEESMTVGDVTVTTARSDFLPDGQPTKVTTTTAGMNTVETREFSKTGGVLLGTVVTNTIQVQDPISGRVGPRSRTITNRWHVKGH